MILNIQPIEFFGKIATKINVFSVYDDMETLYIMNVAIQDANNVTISSVEIKIEGEDYTETDWNSTESLVTLIETQCDITITA